jgi:hypothetical protein
VVKGSGAGPIQFADKQWLDYVPVRIPTAMTVKERLPAGAAAVLLNPSHRHTDIYLTIDASEERLLDAIDGSRSIKEIVQTDNKDNVGEFFQRLWHYDQIVFDASSR